MAELVYDPPRIFSQIKNIYCHPDKLISSNCLTYGSYIPVSPNFDRRNLFLLEYVSNKWICYHCDLNMSQKKIEKIYSELDNYMNVLFSNWTYLFMIGSDFNLYAIKITNELGYMVNIPEGVVMYDTNCQKFVSGAEDLTNSMLLDSDMGIIHLNSLSCFDFIFYLFVKSDDLSIQTTAYQIHNTDIMEHFRQCFLAISTCPPIPEHCMAHQYFRSHDTDFFKKKMEGFQKEIISILGLAQSLNLEFVTNFVRIFKKEICLEINYIYQRFKNYPSERNALLKSHANHPYIKLVKIVHQQYINGRMSPRVDPENISKLFFQDTDALNYDELLLMLIDAVSNRSSFFCPCYEAYLDTDIKKIKPRYKQKYNYYPMLVFSPVLFVMEHLLQLF